MNNKEIEIRIKKDGTVNVEAFNYEGNGCHEDVTEIASILGDNISTEKKDEFYQSTDIHETY